MQVKHLRTKLKTSGNYLLSVSAFFASSIATLFSESSNFNFDFNVL